MNIAGALVGKKVWDPQMVTLISQHAQQSMARNDQDWTAKHVIEFILMHAHLVKEPNSDFLKAVSMKWGPGLLSSEEGWSLEALCITQVSLGKLIVTKVLSPTRIVRVSTAAENISLILFILCPQIFFCFPERESLLPCVCRSGAGR